MHAVEQLVSLSLHTVSGSHIVSLQGLVVALGELDCLHDNCGLQGEIFQQARWKRHTFCDLPRKIMQHYFSLILLVTSESQVLQDSQKGDVEIGQDRVYERMRWKVLLQPYWGSVVCYRQPPGHNNL